MLGLLGLHVLGLLVLVLLESGGDDLRHVALDRLSHNALVSVGSVLSGSIC